SPECSSYHWDHFGLHLPCLFQFFFQPLVLLSLLVLFLPDVAVSWDCHIYHDGPLLLLVNHHHVWLVSQQLLFCLELEVPQDLSSAILNHLWWCLPFGLRDVQSIFGTDVPVHYPSHLVMPLSCILSQLASYTLLLCAGLYGVSLHSLHMGVLSAVVDPCLYGSGAEGLLLCCHDQSLCAVFQTSLF
ncbi:hypothetical protein LDENG_00121310, partial [Lucifuga dentata]